MSYLSNLQSIEFFDPSHKSNVTVVSTGSCPADWRRWWSVQSQRDGASWTALLHQHERIFEQLCQHHGLPS